MDYWVKLNQLAETMPTPAIRQQVAALTAWRTAVAAHQLPTAALPRLGLTGETMAEAQYDFQVPLRAVVALDHLLRHFRQYIAYHFGMWAFVQQSLFAEWTALFGPRRYLEVAAGNGYVSFGLQAAGNRVIASDSLTWQSQRDRPDPAAAGPPRRGQCGLVAVGGAGGCGGHGLVPGSRVERCGVSAVAADTFFHA
nr:hypothetical protein [Lacticaseibacillus camelliae]